jgi:hypothetical protein
MVWRFAMRCRLRAAGCWVLTTGYWLLATGYLPSQEPQSPLFILHTANGALDPAPLDGVEEDWSISLGGTNPKQISGSEVISLRRAAARLSGSPLKEQVLSVNGDRLAGKVLQLGRDRLRLAADIDEKSRTTQEITLPLASLSVLWLVAPGETAPAQEALRRIEAPGLLTPSGRRRQDVVILRNGDSIEGTLTGIDENSLRIAVGPDRDTTLERSQVAVVALSSELGRPAVPKGVYGRLRLANGCRLTIASARSDGRVLNAKTLFGATVQVSVDQIAALDLYQGRATYLSDLKPSRYQHVPYLDTSWPYRTDASVLGNAIQLGGTIYDKGLGMHSESRLTYDLRGGYQWFEALVGLDDQTGKEGSVLIQVLVDGKPQDVAESQELTAGNSPRSVRVRVAGAKELTLVVKFGRHGDVQDHVNWADARLLK